jgi:hypothetical protein
MFTFLLIYLAHDNDEDEEHCNDDAVMFGCDALFVRLTDFFLQLGQMPAMNPYKCSNADIILCLPCSHR